MRCTRNRSEQGGRERKRWERQGLEEYSQTLGLKTQVRNPGSVCFCSALTLTANERGSQTPGHSLPEDDDRSALLDVLRPDAVGDFISSISTEKKQHVSMDGQPKIPGVRGQK